MFNKLHYNKNRSGIQLKIEKSILWLLLKSLRELWLLRLLGWFFVDRKGIFL